MPTNRPPDAAARGKGRPRAFDRDLALHRALEVFWRQGYAPASVASLCKAMKINPPSLYATFGNNAIKVPTGKLQKFVSDSYIGKEVYMGIRPENIHDEDVFIQAAPNAVVDCNVEVTELMGSETYLYLSTSGKEENIIARVNPRTTSRAGQKVQIAFDVNHLHFFDKETETTLLTR